MLVPPQPRSLPTERSGSSMCQVLCQPRLLFCHLNSPVELFTQTSMTCSAPTGQYCTALLCMSCRVMPSPPSEAIAQGVAVLRGKHSVSKNGSCSLPPCSPRLVAMTAVPHSSRMILLCTLHRPTHRFGLVTVPSLLLWDTLQQTSCCQDTGYTEKKVTD